MKFYHKIVEGNKGGITIAYDIVNNEVGKRLVFSFAQCSKKDYYCKKTGRDIAVDNFIAGKTTSMVVKGTHKAIRERIQQWIPLLAMDLYHLQNN